jgi:hypothetical protein
MSKIITDLPLATQLNPEDQFIFYSNSKGETQRISAENSANLTVPNTPAVLAATTNAALGIANAALADAKAAEALANAATAQASAEGAQTSANGKAKVYYQSSAPTGGTYSTGDIWYDTDDNYKIYVRSGSSWVASFGPMLKLDGNNNISGLLKADGTDKSFVLVADNFQVWNGVSAEVPFEVVEDPSNPPNQVVRIKNAQIQTVDAGKITSGFLSSQVIELANTNAYLQSSSFIETWTSGRVFRQKSLGKATPSDQLQCKVEQANGTFIVYDCLSTHTSSGASFPGVGGLWAATDPQPSSQSIGFRINGNGQAEFNGVNVRGNIIANTGYFGSGSDTIKIGADLDASGGASLYGANGLTLGNKGYIKSAGLTYSGSNFTGSASGFFLGNTQGYDQTSVYQFFIGDPASNFLRWNGTNLIINGRIATGSVLGEPGSGSSVNSEGGLIIGSTIGIRRNVDNNVLSITGGTGNWGGPNANDGAGQIDLVGKNNLGGNAGVVQLIGGKVNTGKVLLRTWLGTGNDYYNCVTASTNGSVGINDTEPSSANGIKLDVYGSMRIREGVVYSTYSSPFNGYTVALNDGTNNIRFQNNNVGLYAKVGSAADVLIASPKLNLSSQQILAPFSFGTAVGSAAGGIVAGTLQWDGNGTITQGSGVAMTPLGLVGGQYGSPKFTIGVNGDATFSGTLSAPVGNFGGWTIGNTNISGGNITIDSSTNNGYIATGQTAYNTGTGFWVGSVSGTAKLSVGNSAGNYLTWDGSSLSIKGSITLVNTIPSGSVSGLGTLATQNSVAYGDITGTKPPSNADVTLNAINGSLTLTGGGLVLASGGASIRGGQTAYNTGAGFWLGDVSGTTKFSLGNPSGNYIAWDGSSLSIKGTISLVNTIPNTSVSGLGSLSTQNSVAYGDITGTKPPSNADVTLNAIQGSLTLTGGGLVLASGGASLRGGQTDYNTGNGFWIGDVGGTSKFSIGNPSGNYVTWDGSTLSVGGTISSASTIGGRSGTDIASAINSGGVISNSGLNNKLNVSTGVILSSFSFEGSNYAGALKAGDITWNTSGAITGGSGIVVNAAGIIGAKNGATTFSISSSTGDAVFRGEVTGTSGSIGDWQISSGSIVRSYLVSNRTITTTLGSNGILSLSNTFTYGGDIILDATTNVSFVRCGRSYLVDSLNGPAIFSGKFISNDDTGYYCIPNSTSNFNALNVGGNAVLTTGSGALTAGASTNLGQLQVNDWLTFDNSQTRLSISDDFGNGNYLTYAGGTNGHRWVNSGNSVQLADLDNSGNLSASSHPTYSSRRFKQNIRPIENALNTLKQLNGKIFDWKTKNVSNDIGFIAEEVNEVLPTLVNFDQDGQTKSLDYSRITALLTEAVKEQSGTISNLVAVIADLESRLKKLETN